MITLSKLMLNHTLYEIEQNQIRKKRLPPKKSKQTILPGVYLLYYYGTFNLYQNMRNQPIYIGKAENSIYQRLKEHTKSIADAINLNITDFRYKLVSIDKSETFIIPGIESMLIQHYCPLWNVQIKGFGNHKPGRARSSSILSEWDKIHPGRKIMLEVKESNEQNETNPEGDGITIYE